ncbi:MAG TPA: acyloxyacyl hydrolase, partial [Stellaceae bacterium]|nr:acyloxyacyl hydrolase [Stellaceae bacterium]
MIGHGGGTWARDAAGTCLRLTILIATVVALFEPTRSFAQNITGSEFKFGVWGHDVHFLGGHEHGVDVNPEMILSSPVTDNLIADAPAWLRWALQPRPTIGGAINTARDTDQAYIGATWSWMLVSNVVNPNDGIFLGYFLGPSFNDGKSGPAPSDRQALGSHVLFREASELGYQINPTWAVSVMIDHISNGGLA